ncbi:MAG: GTPase, partial [Rugosibacter sp.]|nr:GTPase [Rugosibacter sp.]
QLAKRYYAGGCVDEYAGATRQLPALARPRQADAAQYLPKIRQQAGTLDMGRVMAMMRGA